MRIFKFFIIVLLISGCSFNKSRDVSIEDYNYYLDMNKQLKFNEAKSINRTFSIVTNNKKEEIKANLEIVEQFHNDYIYYLYVDDGEIYESYYYDDINYIKNNDEKYAKKVLLNAYRDMVGKYLHTDFVDISYTGIEKIAITDSSISMQLNDAGILEYFNDIYYRYDMYIEEPDYVEGKVNISYTFANYVVKHVDVEGEIKYKNNNVKINEVINVKDSKEIKIIDDFDTYTPLY